MSVDTGIRRVTAMESVWKRRVLAFALFSAFLTTVAPCGAQRQARDSAGVRLLRYDLNATVPVWTVDPAPLLEIGGADGSGPTEFARILGVRRLSSGRVAVANGAGNEIRLFDPQGKFLSALGRAGQGPGEFQRLSRLYAVADTLIGTDQTQAAQVFSPDGKLIRSLPRPVLPNLALYGDRLGFLPDGRSVMMAMSALDSAPAGRSRRTAKLVLVPGSDSSFDALGDFPVFELHRQGTAMPTPVWFGPFARVAVTPATICVGYSQNYHIDCFGHRGNLISRVERATRPRAVTEGDRKFVTERALRDAKAAPKEIRAKLEDMIRLYQYSDRVPAFGAFLAASTGELWVKEFERSDAFAESSKGGDAALRWSVFSPRGDWVADVLLPAHFSPLDVGRDYVAGVSFDADDVERVTVLRLRR